MIDVHCHLNFHAFAKDFDDVIKSAREKGVTTIINVGTKIDSSEKAVELAQQYEDLHAIVGVHPHHADKVQSSVLGYQLSDNGRSVISPSVTDSQKTGKPNAENRQQKTDNRKYKNLPNDWVKQIEILAKKPKVVGIGEIGLDYFSYKSNGIVEPKLQKQVFEAQIALAHKVNLPIQIHGRHAGKDIIAILKHHKNLLKSNNPGMFHCFAGDMDTLKQALELGFCIGFDGNSTYPGLAPGETVSLSDIAKATPLDRIVTETDSPFLSPIPLRGSRNEPSRVIIVGEYLARLKNISFEEFDRISTENAERIFKIN